MSDKAYHPNREPGVTDPTNMSKRIISDQKAYEIIARNKALEATIKQLTDKNFIVKEFYRMAKVMEVARKVNALAPLTVYALIEAVRQLDE